MSQGYVVWFTGISGAGKTTLARLLQVELADRGIRCECIDGDDVRTFFGHDVGFTPSDRLTNLKRIVYAARLLAKHGVVVIVAAIAPHYEGRDFIRSQIENYVQVYLEIPVSKAMERDTKSLYEAYAGGALKDVIGMDGVYENPRTPDLVISTAYESAHASLEKVLSYLGERGVLSFSK